jgi:hypothetical protein
MSDESPESASARDASSPAPEPDAGQWPVSPATGGFAAPDPGGYQPWPGPAPAAGYGMPYPTATQAAPQRPWRRIRGPLLGFVAGAVAVVVGLGVYLVVHNLANRSNTPVATSSVAKSGGITVSGHGIKMTFPTGWVNVPTSPNQARRFMKNFAHKYHISGALQSEVENPQVLSGFAMFVFRVQAQGNFTENLNALVAPGVTPPSQMMAELKSGEGPAKLGATDVHYKVTYFGRYPGVLVTYILVQDGITLYGAQSYLDGPANLVVTTVTSRVAATSEADLKKIVDTITFT